MTWDPRWLTQPPKNDEAEKAYLRRNYTPGRVQIPSSDWNRNPGDNKGFGPDRGGFTEPSPNDFGPTGPVPPTTSPAAAARPLPYPQERPLEAPPFRRIGYPKREPATRPGRRR